MDSSRIRTGSARGLVVENPVCGAGRAERAAVHPSRHEANSTELSQPSVESPAQEGACQRATSMPQSHRPESRDSYFNFAQTLTRVCAPQLCVASGPRTHLLCLALTTAACPLRAIPRRLSTPWTSLIQPLQLRRLRPTVRPKVACKVSKQHPDLALRHCRATITSSHVPRIPAPLQQHPLRILPQLPMRQRRSPPRRTPLNRQPMPRKRHLPRRLTPRKRILPLQRSFNQRQMQPQPPPPPQRRRATPSPLRPLLPMPTVRKF